MRIAINQSLKNLARRIPGVRRVVRRVDDATRDAAFAREETRGMRERLAELELPEKPGYCHCCRQPTRFETTGDWLRDHFLCGLCLSIPRQRHLQYVLDTRFPGWENKTLHESSPSHDFIARYSTAYSASQYFEDVAPGSYRDGVRSENLEALTFDDESFDIFVTQDVFEHILNPDRAAQEILRVLKPGGVHVFTAPRRMDLADSRRRARMTDSTLEYLLEPQYHGNPIGDGRSLVTWDYGRDFEELYAEWCGGTTTTFLTRDRSLGLDGEYLDVFVSRKPSHASGESRR